MSKLHAIHADSEHWDKALKHKHGVDVFVRKDIVNLDGKDRKIPIYRGVLTIPGFTPSAVFAVIAQRDLWDDWYDHGNLVADLNDRTSITYMNMKPPGTARPRDMALVERVEVDSEGDGTITFCATSTQSVKVPQVHGRTRAYMALNGWVLTPLQRNGQTATMLSYYVQAEAQGLIPGTLSAKLLSRRPVAIYKVAEYLKKHGAPPNKAANGTSSSSSSSQQRAPATVNGSRSVQNGSAVNAGGAIGKNWSVGPSEQAQEAEALESTLPPQAPFDDTHPSSKAVLSAKHKFEEALSSTDWQQARSASGSSIFFRPQQRSQGQGQGQGSLPVVRGVAEIEGFTTEQILGTIASTSARRVWDEMYVGTGSSSSDGAESINGAHQVLTEERRKGIHPHLPEQRYRLARGVFREDTTTESGPLLQVSTSYGEANSSGAGAQADYIGWKLTPSSSGYVRAERIASTSLSIPSSRPVPDFVERILMTSEAEQPHRLSQFLSRHGHAPYFLRWGKGRAALLEEVEGDIEKGETAWRIGSNKRHTAGSTSASASQQQQDQVAWLQWDRKMYRAYYLACLLLTRSDS